jgi:hypothetical protein
MARVLNEFFASVFSGEESKPVPDVQQMNCHSKLENSPIMDQRI